MTDEDYMTKALVEARQAYEEGEIPVGVVVVCKDRIIARAHNLTETLHDVTAHAEMQAITAAALCNSRTLCDVCRSFGMVTIGASSLWCKR